MDSKTFQKLFKGHRKKLSAAWIRLDNKDWEAIGGDLERFLERASEVYSIPREVLLKELDAVKKNIDVGIEVEDVPYLDPIE